MIVLLLLLATEVGLWAQYSIYELHNNDTLHVYNCQESYGNAFTNNAYGDLAESFDALVVIHTNGIHFSGRINALNYVSGAGTQAACHLRVWDENGNTITDTNEWNYYGNFDATSTRYISIHMEPPLDVQTASQYFSVAWQYDSLSHECLSLATDIQATNITTTGAVVSWQSAAPCSVVECGGQRHIVRGHSINLTGLQPNTTYDISITDSHNINSPCCAVTSSFTTEVEACIGMPDFTDLHSHYCRAYSGTFYSYGVGMTDAGTASQYSTHTIHTDPNETDPRTANQLHTVCPGMSASVRMGSWRCGGRCQSLTYRLHVDTAFYSLLILRYAALLQNPGHDYEAQPKFTFEILNSNGNVIDPVCGAATYVADANLGWNNENMTLWKDWTTVGFNLAPYHGQDVTVRFYVADCTAGGHYGYVYFNAECINRSVSSSQCGFVTSNTVTAPDGFNYRWYYQDPSDPFSSQQSITYSTTDEYIHCRLISKDNPSCHVEMATYGYFRFPYAQIDTLPLADLDCNGYRATFVNRSHIGTYNSDTLPTFENCESALWFFGDGDSSSDYTPNHIYYDSGDYDITLVAGIANDQCLDTAHLTIHIPDKYITESPPLQDCDSTTWLDGITYFHDTVGPAVRYHNSRGCDTVRVLNLKVYPSADILLPVDTFCYSDTYAWHDRTFGSDTITRLTHYLCTDSLMTLHGCDSAVTLLLVQLPRLHPSIAIQTDCTQRHYRLSYTVDSISILPDAVWWQASPADSMLEDHDHDPTIFTHPSAATLYTLTLGYGDSLFCPSIDSAMLHPVEMPTAQLKVIPEVLNLNHLDFDAYDINPIYPYRSWAIAAHPSTDTLRLHETSPGISGRASALDDSITVILAVGNDYCYDTSSITVPIVRTAVFIPNVFTPDADINNRFTAYCEGLLEGELTVYNRQGLLVFATTDLDQGWDGTHHGTPCPQGAYVWHLRARTADRPDDWHTLVGTVTLLR